MRQIPNGFVYCGLTIILGRLGRFDSANREGVITPISGKAGDWFDSCLAAGGQAGVNRHSVEVRTTASIGEPFLEGTTCVLLLGPEALRMYKPDVSLDEQRGSPWQVGPITFLASYAPQDCYDRRDYFNPNDDDDDKDEAEVAEGKSTHGRTQRKNWRFWARQDIKKASRISQKGLSLGDKPNYHLWPKSEDVCQVLLSTKGRDLYFDIETDSNLQLTCFGFSLDEGKNIYVVPMLQTYQKPSPTYHYGVDKTALVLRALAVALRDNTVVIHNSCFDLFVLAWRYAIPLCGPVYDTMLAHNRCFIEVEKSLGHVMSLYTDLPYHKNEGVFEPHNYVQTQQLYEYNGKDVFALAQLKPALEREAARLRATESVELVNRSVLPYLTMTLQGMRLSEEKIAKIVDYHERWNIQLKRILKGITGGLEFNPNSWQQVSRYLYESTFTTQDGKSFRIPKPKVDPTNEKTLLQLLLKHDVPAIYAILKYRGNQKRISKAALKSKNKPPRYYYGLHNTTNTHPRLTCSWRLAKTVTMRLGSSKLLRRWGDNSQNYEKELRKTVVPDPGLTLLQADQSGAEALIVAYLCTPGQLRDLFLYGINPHVFLGLHLFSEQFSAELGYSLDFYRSLPVKLLAAEKKLKEIAKCIKASDNWEPSRRYYFMAKQGNHCVDAQTEVLTSDGWIRVDKYDSVSPIATFEKPTSKIEFEKPLAWHSFDFDGKLLYFQNKMVDQLVTPEHRMVYHVGGDLLEKTADKLSRLSKFYIPTSGLYSGPLTLPDSVARLIVATQADGCIYGDGLIRFRFRKADKAERIRMLLKSAELPYTETAYDGDCPFIFLVKKAHAVTDYFKPTKLYGSWLLNFSGETLDTIIEELSRWDGYSLAETNHKRTQCSTAEPENSEWIKTVVHLRGRQSCVTIKTQPTNRPIYTNSINNRAFSIVNARHRKGELRRYTGKVYCPTVSAGFFLIRRDGVISVTGNSLNYDCQARAFRLNTLLKSEGAVALDMDMANKIIETRINLFPELNGFWNDTILEARRTGILRNLFGHPRVVTGHIEPGTYKELYAFKPQSTVGQITNYAITELQEKIAAQDELMVRARVDVLQNNHDSVLLQCLPEYKEEVGRVLSSHLSRPLVSPRGEPFSMKCEVQWGESWGKMEELNLSQST